MEMVKKTMDYRMEECASLISQSFTKVQTLVEAEINSHQQQTKPYSSAEYMALYSTIYSLLATNPDRVRVGDLIYAEYIATFDAYLPRHVLPSLLPLAAASSPLDRSPLLLELERRLAAHAVMVAGLSRPIGYLDRIHLGHFKLPLLVESGYVRFREIVFDRVKVAATEAMLAMLESDRDDDDGGGVDYHPAVKIAVGVFVEMGIDGLSRYCDDFEAAMLRETEAYYGRKAERWMESGDVPEYMAKAEEAIRKEEERARKFLHSSSEQKVMEKVREALLVAHVTRLLENEESGFLALVRADKTDDVKRIFRVYLVIEEQLGMVAKLLESHMLEEGMGIVEASDGVIEKLLALHRRYSAVYARGCFESHSLFEKALSEAFTVLANEKVAGDKLMVELLAEFCEEVLKKGGLSENMSGEKVEETMEDVAELLAYISDKDIFLEFHRQNLSRRLLNGQAVSEDYDNCLMSKLKSKFGVNFTVTFEVMMKDIADAREDSVRFEKYVKENDVVVGDANLSVTVVTTHHWPISDNSGNIVVPAKMASCIEAFTGFYRTKFPTRKLDFLHPLGTCDLQCNFESKTIDLVVTLYQAILILLFNDNDKLTVPEIMKKLNMDDKNYLVRLLHSLSCSKYKILTKTPQNDTVAIEDVFEFNAKFDDKMEKIRIPPPSSENQDEEEEEQQEKKKKVFEMVEMERQYCADAAIVRTMKRQKSINFQELMNECIEILKDKFTPDLKLIKQRVEDLIEKEFLERDESDNNILNYVP